MTVTVNKAINRFLASLGTEFTSSAKPMTFRVAGIEGKRVDDCIVNSFSPPLIILAVIPTAGRNLITAMWAKTPKEFNFDNPVQASLRAQLGDKESHQVSELRSSSTPTELRRSVYVATPSCAPVAFGELASSVARGYQCASPTDLECKKGRSTSLRTRRRRSGGATSQIALQRCRTYGACGTCVWSLYRRFTPAYNRACELAEGNLTLQRSQKNTIYHDPLPFTNHIEANERSLLITN